MASFYGLEGLRFTFQGLGFITQAARVEAWSP